MRKGELLATIDAPALDEQLGTAQANLAVADARSKLADVTAKRWKSLAGTQAVAQQDIDVQVAGAVAQQAQVQAARHEVGRYQALEAFKRIVAPFDGVVTSRRTDVGSFVNAAGGDAGAPSAASELFTVADIHRLRLFVSVPEDYADVLKPGLTATLRLPQFPNRTFQAHYETTAARVQPAVAQCHDRADGGQPRPRDLARHLRQRALHRALRHRGADRAGAGAAVPRAGHAGRRGGRTEPACTCRTSRSASTSAATSR